MGHHQQERNIHNLVILVAATVEAPNHETTSSPQSTPASLWKYAATGQCHTPLGDIPWSTRHSPSTPRACVQPRQSRANFKRPRQETCSESVAGYQILMSLAPRNFVGHHQHFAKRSCHVGVLHATMWDTKILPRAAGECLSMKPH